MKGKQCSAREPRAWLPRLESHRTAPGPWFCFPGSTCEITSNDLNQYEEISSHARICLEQSLSSRDEQGAAASLVLLGAIAQHQGDFRNAIQKCQEAMRAFPQLDGMYWVNMRIGLCYEADQQYSEAIQAFLACLARGRRTGEMVKTGWSLQNIGDTLMLQGNVAEAQTYLEQALALFRQVGTPIGVLWSTYSLGRVAFGLGKPPAPGTRAGRRNACAPDPLSILDPKNGRPAPPA